MSAVLVGWGELHRDVPAALCLLASEHSAGLTGKDSATTLPLPPDPYLTHHSGCRGSLQPGHLVL